MMRLIFTMLFLFVASATFSQDYASDENYFSIILDGKEAFINKNTGEVVKPGEAYTKTAATNTPQPTYGANKNSHTVKKGETLYSISRKYGVSVDDLRRANGLKSNALGIGENLSIPNATASYQSNVASSGSSYMVKKGDTLYSISRRYGKTVAQIKSMNGLHSNVIQPGQSLRIN